MWQALQSFVFGALVASLVLAAIMHVVMGGIDFTQTAGRRGAQGPGGAGEDEAGQASPFARAQRAAAPQLPQIDLKLGGRAVAHLSGILAAIFVVVGVGQLFRGWSLLYSTAGAIYGAGYTDVHIRLPLTYVTHGRRLPARRGARLEHPQAGTSGGRSSSPSGSSPSSCCAASSRPCTSRSS